MIIKVGPEEYAIVVRITPTPEYIVTCIIDHVASVSGFSYELKIFKRDNVKLQWEDEGLVDEIVLGVFTVRTQAADVAEDIKYLCETPL